MLHLTASLNYELDTLLDQEHEYGPKESIAPNSSLTTSPPSVFKLEPVLSLAK